MRGLEEMETDPDMGLTRFLWGSSMPEDMELEAAREIRAEVFGVRLSELGELSHIAREGK
jgi:hypothetical protein